MAGTRSGLSSEVNEAFFLYQRLNTKGHPIKNDTILIPCNEVSRFIRVQDCPSSSQSVERVEFDHSDVSRDEAAPTRRTSHSRKNQLSTKFYVPEREDEGSSDNLDGSKPSKKQKKLKRRIKDKEASKPQDKTEETPRCSPCNQETSPSPILLFNIINSLPCSYTTANTIGTIGQSNQTYFDPEYTAEQERKRDNDSLGDLVGESFRRAQTIASAGNTLPHVGSSSNAGEITINAQLLNVGAAGTLGSCNTTFLDTQQLRTQPLYALHSPDGCFNNDS